MEKLGILKNDVVDRERAEEIKWTRNEDILDVCAKEARGSLKIQSLFN